MDDHAISVSCTNVLVRNVPEHTNKKFLEFYFRSRLDLPKCQVKQVATRSHGRITKVHAYIDVRTYEKVQQAIRELNGSEIERERITVAMAMRKFSSTPGKKVHLQNFPSGTRGVDLYDLLSKFGTVVGIETSYRYDEPCQSHSACATFLTEVQAQYAIRRINSLRQRADSILAVRDKRYVPKRSEDKVSLGTNIVQETHGAFPGHEMMPLRGRIISRSRWRRVFLAEQFSQIGEEESTYSPREMEGRPEGMGTVNIEDRADAQIADRGSLCLDSLGTEEEKREAVCAWVFERYGRDIQPRKRLEKALEVLRNSLDSAHMLTLLDREERFHVYVHMAESALKGGDWKVIQLSEAALKAAKSMKICIFGIR